MLHTDLTNYIASKSIGDKVLLKIYRIEGLATLTIEDKIPKGEIIEVLVELEAPGEAT